MPRKKKPEKNRYKNIVCMKVTDIELEILNQHAATAGLSRSEYLRKLFLEKEIHVHYEIVSDMKILRELLGNMERSVPTSIRLPGILTPEEKDHWRWKKKSATVFPNCLNSGKKY